MKGANGVELGPRMCHTCRQERSSDDYTSPAARRCVHCGPSSWVSRPKQDGRLCVCCRERKPTMDFAGSRARKCEACKAVAPAPRTCRRCGEVKSVEALRPHCSVCVECVAKRRKRAAKPRPRYCVRCHERKPAAAFPIGKQSHSGGVRKPKTTATYVRHSAVCQDCWDDEKVRRAEAKAKRQATFKRGRVYVRRCSSCQEVKSLTSGFYVTRYTNGKPMRSYECKECQKRRVAAHKATLDPEEMRRKRREWRREWRRRNPERAKAAQKRWRERMRADPERYARHVESNRITYRLRIERQTGKLPTRKRTATMPSDDLPRLPAEPLAVLIARIIEETGHSQERVCRAFGVSDKSFRRWRDGGESETGEPALVLFDVADTVLTRSGTAWWEVWPPEKYPQVAEVLAA